MYYQDRIKGSEDPEPTLIKGSHDWTFFFHVNKML